MVFGLLGAASTVLTSFNAKLQLASPLVTQVPVDPIKAVINFIGGNSRTVGNKGLTESSRHLAETLPCRRVSVHD